VDAEYPEGERGVDGTSGSSTAKYLSFDGRASDSDVGFAFVFLDQCRMLLNNADQYYFVNSVDDWAYAAELYSRLISRLAFVQNMTDESMVCSTYQQLEFGDGITINAVDELHSVYTTAILRKEQMRSGKRHVWAFSGVDAKVSIKQWKV
jgi:hypothetical protein